MMAARMIVIGAGVIGCAVAFRLAEAVRNGIRPIPKDSYPGIGPIPRVGGYDVAVTHSGVTMAPMIDAAVADELAHGRERAELSTFRPSRFFN